jgi:hypothetical protein
MATKDNYNKTLRFSVETDEKLGKLAQKFGLSKFQFFNRMVEYFHHTKKDPADINDEVLKNALVKNHDTYIRFIRAQEEKLLIPIKTEVDRMIGSQLKIIDRFNEQVLKANKDLLAGQDRQQQHNTETEKLLIMLMEKLDSKENLKLKFRYILDYYYSKAAQSASTREKETLLQEARQQISRL